MTGMPAVEGVQLRTLHPFDQLAALEGRLQRALAPGHCGLGDVLLSGLTFRVGHWHLAVPMQSLTEILRPVAVTRVPGAKPWFRGIMNLRGTLLSVTDLGLYAGVEAVGASRGKRILVLHGDAWSAGLEVHEVFGLRSFHDGERVAAPPATGTPLDDYRIDAFRAEGEVWLVLDPTRLLSDSRFRAAAA